MATYTIISTFTAPSIAEADAMHGELNMAFLDLLDPNGCGYGGMAMVRGGRITESDIAESNELAEEFDQFLSEGHKMNDMLG